MPKRKLAKTNGYKELVKKIQAELEELDFFIRRRTAESYWRVGKFIHEHLLEYEDRAGYGDHIFELLSEDIDRDASTLSKMLRFYRAYPILARGPKLSWSLYRVLMVIKDKDQRQELEKKAIEKDWGAEDLQEAIRLDRLTVEEPEKKPGQVKKLSVTRARLFTYKVLEPSYIHPVEEWFTIDQGFYFNTTAKIKGLRLKAGDIIESAPATKRGGSANFSGGKSPLEYSFTRSEAKPKELYTYKALVERVVDADTYWLNIDLGFHGWFRHKIRLRGIDCPELSTKEGQEAKKFVESRLKQVAFVVVKIYKDDKYGRYLTDVFYLKGETDPRKVLEKGIFLNQELLDLGLAKEMKD